MHRGCEMENSLAIRNENCTGIAEWQMMKDQASVLVKTGFLPESIKTAEQAMAIMLTGKELGIPPMQALRGVHVIKGTPSIRPELMLALCVQRIRGFKYHFGLCDDKSATFICSRPEMSEPFISTFTLEDAKRAQLTANPSWSKYPANMLRWRAVGNALHIVAPDVLVGIYTPDELGVEVDESGDVIDVPVTSGEPVAADSESIIGSGNLNKKIHAMCHTAFGKTDAGKEEFVLLKKQLFGENIKTPDMTASQASTVIDALQAIIDGDRNKPSEAESAGDAEVAEFKELYPEN